MVVVADNLHEIRLYEAELREILLASPCVAEELGDVKIARGHVRLALMIERPALRNIVEIAFPVNPLVGQAVEDGVLGLLPATSALCVPSLGILTRPMDVPVSSIKRAAFRLKCADLAGPATSVRRRLVPNHVSL
jgi:hypothetical protein